MKKYFNSVANDQGQPVAGASVLVVTYPGGTLATIYSDAGVTPVANPLTTDGNGAFSFYAADGHYSLEISGKGLLAQTITDVLLQDATDGALQASLSSLVVSASSTLPANTTIGGQVPVVGPTPVAGVASLNNLTGALTVSGAGVISVSAAGSVLTIAASGVGAGTVTSVAVSGSAAVSVSGSPITSSGTVGLDLTNTGVTAGNYGDASHVPTFSVDAKGRITGVTPVAITGGGTVTSVAASGSAAISVSGSPITSSGTLAFDLTTTGVTSGTYGDTSHVPQITIDDKGRITSAASVAVSGGSAVAWPYFNVMAPPYNATGNGTTDDTAAIQAAVNAAIALGYGTVFFPQGTYLVSSTITIPNTWQGYVAGVGWGSQIKATGNIYAFTITGTAQQLKAIAFTDLLFMAATSGGSHGVSTSWANGILVSRCFFMNLGTGFLMQNTYGAQLYANRFINVGAPVYSNTATNQFVFKGNIVIGTQSGSTNAAVTLFYGGQGFDLSDNTVQQGAYSAFNLNGCSSIRIVNNYCEGLTSSYFTLAGCAACSITHNWFGQLSSGSQVLAGCAGLEFKYNTLYNLNITLGSGLSKTDIGENYYMGSAAYINPSSLTAGNMILRGTNDQKVQFAQVTVSASANVDTTATVSWPEAFTTAIAFAGPISYAAVGQTNGTFVSVNSFNLTQATITVHSSVTQSVVVVVMGVGV